MNVLHININYFHAELHRELIKELNKDVDNTVFAPCAYGAEWSVEKDEWVVDKECFGRFDRILYFLKQSKIFNALIKSVDLSEIDLIHAYTLFSDGNVAYNAKKKYGIPYVVAIRDTDINYFLRFRKFLLPRGIKILEEAERVFFLSPAYKKMFFEKFLNEKQQRKIAQKTMIVPNGIHNYWLENTNHVHKTLKSDNKINLLTVGTLCKRKNIPMVINATNILKHRDYDIDLTVIGKKVDKDIYNCIIENAYKHYDLMPCEQLIDFYRNADIFVLPSLTETFGLVYAEALSQSLPVIYTKNEGFDGQFSDGEIGYSVDCHDSNDIADKIEMIINNYDNIQQKCCDAAQRFRWDKISKIYVDEYMKITRGK